MSLVVTTYVPEGIVMASDSRQSITLEGKTADGKDLPKMEIVNSDNVYKTHLLSKKDKDGKIVFEVGVQNFGQDLLGGIPTASHLKRFTEEELTDEDNVDTVAEKLLKFFKNLFPTADTGFHVTGYKKDGKVSVPYIFYCHTKAEKTERKNIKPDGNLTYGATWSGQPDIINGLISPIFIVDAQGKQQIIKNAPAIVFDAMPLQDAIDFSVFAIRTTIDTIRFQARLKNVGGQIDVLILTPDGARWIFKKELKS